jgi:hypothetical protein
MTIQSETIGHAVAQPCRKIITHAVNSKGLRYRQPVAVRASLAFRPQRTTSNVRFD